MLSLHRPDRCRQDRARQAARIPPGQRVHPLRHERVHGEARRGPPHRRAARICRLRAGRAARRRRSNPPLQRRAARRDREGAPRHLQRALAGDGPRHAHGQHWTEGRLPQHGADSDLERRLARNGRRRDRVFRRRPEAGRRAAWTSHRRQGQGRARTRLQPGIPQPPGRHRHLQAADAGGDGDDRGQVHPSARESALGSARRDYPHARRASMAGGGRLRQGLRRPSAGPGDSEGSTRPARRSDSLRPARARRNGYDRSGRQ